MSGNNETFPYPPAGQVGQWWIQMVIVAIFNIFFFAFTWVKTKKNLSDDPNPHPTHIWNFRYVYWMRLLAIPFVLQTTWRSFLPSLYNNRQTIIEGDVNSVIIARTGAFIGEICWGIQIGWALRVITRTVPMRGPAALQNGLRKYIPYVTYYIPLAAIAGNVCSVVGMITTNYALVVTEETLWASIFLFGGICALLLWHYGCDSWTFGWGSNCFGYDINPFDDPNKEYPSDPASLWVMRMFIRGYALFGFAATPFMVIVDIPKWYNRYQNDELLGVQYFGFAEGIVDAATRQVPSQDYADWDQDVFWMSAYFSFAVWTSIFLMHAPGHIPPSRISPQSDQAIPVVSSGGPIVQGV